MFLLPEVPRFKTHEHSLSLPIHDMRITVRPEFLKKKKKKNLMKLRKGKVIPLQGGVAQRVGRDITLLFHDCDTRRG